MVKKTKNTCTFHNLFGLKPVDVATDEPNYSKCYDVSEIKHVHFEECYLFTIAELSKIYEFIEEHKNDMTFSCAGDNFQLGSIKDELNPMINYNKYHDRIFAKMFPTKLTFNHCKRVKTEEDSIKVRNICDDLRNGMHISEVRKKYGFKYTSFDELKNDVHAAKGSHVSFTRNTASKVNSWAFPLVHNRAESIYRVGDKLLGNPNGKVFKTNQGKKYVASNQGYEITGKRDNFYDIISLDDTKFTCDINDLVNEFKRDHCLTCHSSQGLTLGDRLYIHDYGNVSLDNRWYFTAITRCRSLDITFITHDI